MATTNIIPCRGLATDANAVMPAPGALRRCENAIIDAPGVASARPNFSIAEDKATDNAVRRVFAHGGEPFFFTEDGGAFLLERDGAELSGGAQPVGLTRSNFQVAKARGNAYFATDSGVRKVSTASDTASATAGMYEAPQTTVSTFSTTNGWWPDGTSIAVRIVYVKEDANGLVTRSAPSPWTYATNNTGNDRTAEVRIALPDYAVAGETLELYRTKAVTAGTNPSDVMYLAQRYTLTSGNISAGFVFVYDELTESQLGEVLYTSSTREGIEGANLRPPRCLALAEWQDSLWCGSTRGSHTLVLDLIAPWDPPPYNVSGCSVTTGSPTITLPAPRTDIRAGAKLRLDTSGAFPAGVTVLSASGTSVTMSANSTVTNAAAEFGWKDVITIDNVEFYGVELAGAPQPTSGEFTVWAGAASNGVLASLTARDLAYTISVYNNDFYAHAVEDTSTSAALRTGRIVIRRVDLDDDSAFSFVDGSTPSTSWEAFSGSFTSELETRPNRIAFSKPLEPEHFRGLDWIEMGRDDAHVLALAPLSGGLLVFKEDGVWSVYGTWPLYSVEKVSEARLVRGDAVSVLDDHAYAWTDRGVLEMTERGVVADLTAGRIRDELCTWTDDVLESDFDSAAGAWVVTWPRTGLVLVGANGITDSRIYAFHTLTREWSMWPVPDGIATRWIGPWYDIDGRRLLYGRQSDGRVEVRESLGETARGYDATYTIASWSYDSAANTVTIAEADLAGWDPRVGDFVTKGEEAAARVVGVDFLGGSYVITLYGTFEDGGSLTAYEGAPGLIEWQRHGVAPASVGGFVREMQIHLDLSAFDDGAWPALETMRVLAGGSSDRSNTVSTLTATPTFETAHSRPLRFGIPRNITRRTHLYPYLEINELVRWRALGIALVGDGVSERVRR